MNEKRRRRRRRMRRRRNEPWEPALIKEKLKKKGKAKEEKIT